MSNEKRSESVVDPRRFDLFAPVTKSAKATGNKAARITCTASSDEVDLGNDRFLRSALAQMRDAFPGMTIFLNHRYEIPIDVFGMVASAKLVDRAGRTDLDLEIEVDANNPRALQTFDQIASGLTLGVSVGVLVTEARPSKEGRSERGLDISSVVTLEASIVGIPANRRGWVQDAIKAASYSFGKALRADSDDVPTSSDLLDVYRFLAGSYALIARDAERERDDVRAQAAELLRRFDHVMDNVLLPRKAVSEEYFAGVAEKYESLGLVPENIAILARLEAAAAS